MKSFKILATISAIITLTMTNPILVYAQEDLFPKQGITDMISDITEDQAKWAYAKKLGEEEKKINAEELRLMSSIIWCEAGNQCEAGKQAVGIIVMNRVEDEFNFGNTVEEVIYWPGQFRPKDDDALNKALGMYDKGNLPNECIEAARYALKGNKTVIYNEIERDMSNYFYFARELKNESLRIEDHDFK